MLRLASLSYARTPKTPCSPAGVRRETTFGADSQWNANGNGNVGRKGDGDGEEKRDGEPCEGKQGMREHKRMSTYRSTPRFPLPSSSPPSALESIHRILAPPFSPRSTSSVLFLDMAYFFLGSFLSTSIANRLCCTYFTSVLFMRAWIFLFGFSFLRNAFNAFSYLSLLVALRPIPSLSVVPLFLMPTASHLFFLRTPCRHTTHTKSPSVRFSSHSV
ncbi:hypothetical protein NMY22_g15027 [Coprinellus aureogranulatus]|nr:hypothetical protein NMY22_g15027 [Coprinellus aureogranulatus]